MKLWVYEDDTGRLVARSGWEGKVCRLVVTPSGWQTTDCPPDLRKNPAKFGKLTLMPVERNCAEVGTLDNGASLILTGAPPGGKMQWRGRNGQKTDSHAGPSGLFKVPFGVTGKICFSK